MHAPSSHRLARVCAVSVGIIVALSACTSDPKEATTPGASPSDAAQVSEQTVDPDFDVEEAQKYLLVGSDLEGDYQPLAQAQIQQALALQVTAQGQTDDAKVEPAACAKVADSQSALGARLAAAAKSAAATVLTPAGKVSSGSDIVTETISPGAAVASSLDPKDLESCSSITIKGPVAATTLNLAQVDVPDLGDDSLGIKITAVSSVGTAQVAVNTVLVLVDQNGKNLTLSIANVSKTTPTQNAELETTAVDLAAKAYDKAKNFLAS